MIGYSLVTRAKAILAAALISVTLLVGVQPVHARMIHGEDVGVSVVTSAALGCGLAAFGATIFTIFTGGLGAVSWAAAGKACAAAAAVGATANTVGEPKPSTVGQPRR